MFFTPGRTRRLQANSKLDGHFQPKTAALLHNELFYGQSPAAFLFRFLRQPFPLTMHPDTNPASKKRAAVL